MAQQDLIHVWIIYLYIYIYLYLVSIPRGPAKPNQITNSIIGPMRPSINIAVPKFDDSKHQ